MASSAPTHLERLVPPPGWWVLSLGLVASVAIAFLFYLGPGWALATGLGTLAVVLAVLLNAAVRIRVDDAGIRVGRGLLEWSYVGSVQALDIEATTRRAGPEADARAHLVLRPYVPTAVEIAVDDTADPVPYWLISTRRPQRFAAAVVARIPSGRPTTAGPQ